MQALEGIQIVVSGIEAVVVLQNMCLEVVLVHGIQVGVDIE